ncbi:hypothetical protein [Nocardia sp. NPDC051570]|uniref:hypothetical protein n=1 Tax=Nocardia sp. NPDC051570 TaxID=3364324 RepID=UPI00379F3889
MIRKSLAIAALAGLAVVPGTAHADVSPAESAARAYIAALLSHNASSVPFAPDCHRVENGVPTGFTGADLRLQLEFGPQYRIITAIHDLTVTTNGDHVDAHYWLDTGLFGIKLKTAEVTESFEVPAGSIKEINANFV